MNKQDRYKLTQEKVLEELKRVYEVLDDLYDIFVELTDEIWEDVEEDAEDIISEYLDELTEQIKTSQADAVRLAISEVERSQHQRIAEYYALCGVQLGASLITTYKNASRDTYTIMEKVPAWRNKNLDVVSRHTAQVRITDTYITSNILSIPWCADGKTYSERLYAHTANFESKLRYVLDQGINKGRGMEWMKKAWRQLVGASAYDTARLLKTETMAMYNRGLKDSYIEMGVEYVEIVGDAECGGICLDYVDGDPIRIADAEINVELPPYHPNCACSFVAYEETEVIENPDEEAENLEE